MNNSVQEAIERMKSRMTSEQREAYDKLSAAVRAKAEEEKRRKNKNHD